MNHGYKTLFAEIYKQLQLDLTNGAIDDTFGTKLRGNIISKNKEEITTGSLDTKAGGDLANETPNTKCKLDTGLASSSSSSVDPIISNIEKKLNPGKLDVALEYLSPAEQVKKIEKMFGEDKDTKKKLREKQKIQAGKFSASDLKDMDEKNFRMQNKRVFLTYKSHINKPEFKTWFENNFPPTLELIMAHESGNEQFEYEHTHVLIHFKKTFTTKSCRRFDYVKCVLKGTDEIVIHPNIKLVLTDQHYDNARRYLAKEDEDNAWILDENVLISRIKGCDSLAEAFEATVKKPGDALGVKLIYEVMKNRKMTKMELTFRKWQHFVFDKLKSDNNREILWVYDKVGNAGKSIFARYLKTNMPEMVYVVKTTGGYQAAANIFKQALQSGWGGQTILIDIVRDCDINYVYTPIELWKDGMVTCTNYECGTFMSDTIPYIAVFSNFLPDVTRLSLDRWNIIEILENKEDYVFVDKYKLEKECLEKKKPKYNPIDDLYK